MRSHWSESEREKVRKVCCNFPLIKRSEFDAENDLRCRIDLEQSEATKRACNRLVSQPAEQASERVGPATPRRD